MWIPRWIKRVLQAVREESNDIQKTLEKILHARARGRGEIPTLLLMILAQITYQDYANCDDGNEGCAPSR